MEFYSFDHLKLFFVKNISKYKWENEYKKIIKFISPELPENYLCQKIECIIYLTYMIAMIDGRTKKNILNNFQT